MAMMIAARVGYSMLIGVALLAALSAFRPTPAEPVQIVERIVIHGNTHTRDKVIRRETGIVESQSFVVDDLASVRRRLYAVGFFLIVAVTAESGSASGLVTLEVSVIEIPRAPAAGFSSVDNFIAEVRICQDCRRY